MNYFSNLFRLQCFAIIVIVDVVWTLQILNAFFINQTIEIIDLNPVLFHHGKSSISELLGALITNDDFYFFLRA